MGRERDMSIVSASFGREFHFTVFIPCVVSSLLLLEVGAR